MIRVWRNAQMDVLRQGAIITPDMQVAYYRDHVWPEMSASHPSKILLAYEDDAGLIGYGGLVHISWAHRHAEISFLLDPTLTDPDTAYAGYFRSFLSLMKSLAFDDLRFRRLYTETYAIREHHIGVLEASGFRREGVMRDHVLIDGRFVDSIIHGYLITDHELIKP
jgi:RimJ/RimL family protein N-acetyltransferase